MVDSLTPTVTPQLCEVDVEVECLPSDGSADCNSIPPLITLCETRPFVLVFRFNGGACPQSANAQIGTPLFFCEDFQGGAPTAAGTQSYILAQDINGDGIIYHAAFVGVGEEFSMRDNIVPGRNVQANMNVTIYSSDQIGFNTMLQTMIYHSSCSSNLFLKDRFGSIQLVLFANDAQGLVSCFYNATFQFSISSTGSFGTTLISLVSATNLGQFNLTDRVNGLMLAPGETFTVNETVVIDLTVRQQYTAISTIEGVSPDGTICSAFDTLQFVAGNPIPAGIPTSAPSVPSVSARAQELGTSFPTPDPLTTACALKGDISCQVTEGQNTNCRGLRAPSATQCIGDHTPMLLQFVYTGLSCEEVGSTVDGFECVDVTPGGPAMSSPVQIDVMSDGESIFSGTIGMSDMMVVEGTIGESIDVTISSHGGAMQTMTIPTGCTEENDLTILNTYGGLQLVGYKNDEAAGVQSIFVGIRITYKIENTGSLSADLTSASCEGAFGGHRPLIDGPETLLGHDEFVLGFEEMRVNLLDIQAETQTFYLYFDGHGTAGGPACGGEDMFEFTSGR